MPRSSKLHPYHSSKSKCNFNLLLFLWRPKYCSNILIMFYKWQSLEFYKNWGFTQEKSLTLIKSHIHISNPDMLFQYFLQVPLNHWCCLPHQGASQPIARSRESCSPGSHLPITPHLSSIMSWSFVWGNDGRSWMTAFLLGSWSWLPET